MGFILLILGLVAVIIDPQFGGQETLGWVFIGIGGALTLAKWIFVTFVLAAASKAPARRSNFGRRF